MADLIDWFENMNDTIFEDRLKMARILVTIGLHETAKLLFPEWFIPGIVLHKFSCLTE